MSKSTTMEGQEGRTSIKSEQLDHAHRGHALLSASSSKQWLNCPPSARLQERFPNESSSYAQEGTFMHEVCEYKLRHDYFHEDVPKPESAEWYTEEVEQVTDTYYEFVVSTIEDFKKSGQEPLVLIEAKLNYTHIAPSGYGTGDMVIVGKLPDGRAAIHVIDFKGGRGVFVEADHNTQMMLYALGALAAYGYIWDIEIVRMTIVQPRLDNISTFECSRAELEAWGESIKPIARMAYEGKGEQKAGDWCKFCRAKPVCKALAEEALALVFSYNLEDIDQTSSGADVFNGQQSVLWKNLREMFPSEIKAMYQNLRSTGALSYAKVEKMFEDHQAKWPEAIFNEDSWFKYLAPLEEKGSAAYLAMLQGSKAEQRKWWLYNRFKYIDSKYNAGDSLTDVITLRGYAKSNITITP